MGKGKGKGKGKGDGKAKGRGSESERERERKRGRAIFTKKDFRVISAPKTSELHAAANIPGRQIHASRG